MLTTLHGEEWLFQSHPVSLYGNMESEIAELRTLTRVTKLRQQIECRQEGSWMVVRDVPDDRLKSGLRKVTSYGRTSRSVTRSFSQNVSGKPCGFASSQTKNVIVEHPHDESDLKTEVVPKTIEITEISDEDQLDITSPEIEKSNIVPLQSQVPPKKTSVVTLGKGNLVLINDEDSNFLVTSISKGRVADAVSTLERVSQGEKKVKKVGFCKTEVHFAPDSGRVKIVETDEKPPPSQVLRKKKRPRNRNIKQDLPKLYFGNSKLTDFNEEPLRGDDNPKENICSLVKEPSPSVPVSTFVELGDKTGDSRDIYGYVNKMNEVVIDTKAREDKPNISYLGNVSPKLSKLLQNSMQHEFQVVQKQIMKNKDIPGVQRTNVDKVIETNKPVKIVTQVCLGAGRGEVEHVLKSSNTACEPIYINKDVPVEPCQEVETKKSITLNKDKTPKPKPRTTVLISPQVKDVRNARLIKQPEKVIKKVMPKPREPVKKEVNQVRTVPKQCSRNTPLKSEKKVPFKTDLSTGNTKLQKLIKNGSISEKNTPEVRVRKTREPLRSFEKVSNGWVGHCIVPIRTTESRPKEAQVTVTTKIFCNKLSPTVHAAQNQGTKRSSVMTETRLATIKAHSEGKSHFKTSLSTNKQFSLSKEHLRSAKMVKELSNKEKVICGPTVKRPPGPALRSVATPTSPASPATIVTDRPPPRVGVVRPCVVQQTVPATKNTFTAVRSGSRKVEQLTFRPRRDSEQSDDSVIRADEEVRAYMFNSRHKVPNCSLRLA